MWSLWDYCKQRYSSRDLKTQTESMDAVTRQSLTQKIVETLNDPGDAEQGGENVEEMLSKIEVELTQANTTLTTLEGKEEFLSIRIRKYQQLLKEQDEHLNSSNNQNNDSTSATTSHTNNTEHPEKLEKQQKNKEALGKVVDVHLTILKSIKDCQRIIASLEQKKFELTNVTKQCREFLVMAEEAEREQQLGVVVDNDETDLLLVQSRQQSDDDDDDKETQPEEREEDLPAKDPDNQQQQSNQPASPSAEEVLEARPKVKQTEDTAESHTEETVRTKEEKEPLMEPTQ
ncbi:expressed unknown protein [Seminavis robusta]|uniref:Uncharacterized protein n=1 Tax=Seminavis robusta TaxID=568900 RepID=A0A9N8H5J5_9STRA|nr:expressed unknown protein [Seminavis robusta]|eukprot:Sro87_g046270.1 n/a (288) ;mRNA; f:115470-116333